MTNALRYVVAILALFALAVLWANTLLRWHQIPAETRNKGLALFPTYLAIVYVVLEAVHRNLPINHGLWLIAVALLIFNGVWGYYLVRDARS